MKLTNKEAIKFHNWLVNPNVSCHKWEIMEELDKIIGHCPTERRKDGQARRDK